MSNCKTATNLVSYSNNYFSINFATICDCRERICWHRITTMFLRAFI